MAKYINTQGTLVTGSSRIPPLQTSYVTLAQFGAVGGSSFSRTALPDDTAAIQAAINYCKTTGSILHLDNKAYRFTSSLDCTFSGNTGRNLEIRGQGMLNSVLVPDLGENYPAVDLTNSAFAKFADFSIQSTTRSNHSVMVLLGETISSGQNLIKFDSCYFVDWGPVSKFCVYGLACDEWMPQKCWFYSRGAASQGGVWLSKQSRNCFKISDNWTKRSGHDCCSRQHV
jgi:hypothetical protein